MLEDLAGIGCFAGRARARPGISKVSSRSGDPTAGRCEDVPIRFGKVRLVDGMDGQDARAVSSTMGCSVLCSCSSHLRFCVLGRPISPDRSRAPVDVADLKRQ